MRPIFECMKTWRAGNGPEEIGGNGSPETERRGDSELSLVEFARGPFLVRGSLRKIRDSQALVPPEVAGSQESKQHKRGLLCALLVPPAQIQSHPVKPSCVSR
jgi:hypothetical protein